MLRISPIHAFCGVPFFVIFSSPLCNAIEGAPDANGKSKIQLEEVVVVARRRAESLQDVAGSVTAIQGIDLKLSNITDAQSLQLVTPGLVYTSQGGFAHAAIRGIGSNATLPTFEPSVGTFIDGVYNPNATSVIQYFSDVERVEVLKGPQGTLFGRNTTGGAINILTRKPGDDFELDFSLTGGSFDRRGVNLFTSVPISERIAASVSAYYETEEPYYVAVNPDNPGLIDRKDEGARVKLRFDATENLEFLLSGYRTRHEGTDTAVGNNIRPSLLTLVAGGTKNDEPWVTTAERESSNDVTVEAADLKMSYDAGWSILSTQLAWLRTDADVNVEFDQTEADITETPVPVSYSETTSLELQLTSSLDGRWDWIGGIYYLEGDSGLDPVILGVGPANVPLSLVPDNILLDFLSGLGLLDPLDISLPSAVDLVIRGLIDTLAYAAYADVNYQLANNLTLTLGARYSYEERTLVETRTDANILDLPDSTNINIAREVDNVADWDDVSAKLGLEYQPDEILYYFTYSEGFKSGNWNPVLLLDPVVPVEPEEIAAIEIGSKAEFFDRRLQANIAAFIYDYDDLQVQVVSVLSAGTARLENAGRAEVKGAELQLTGLITSGLKLDVGVSYLKSEYKEYEGTGFDPATGLSFTGDFSGNELFRAPELSGNTALTYRFSWAALDFSVSANAYYNSGFYFDAQNTVEQESYWVYGANATVSHTDSGFSLSLVGSNLAEEPYLVNGMLTDFGAIGTYGAPRRYAVALSWSY